MALRGPRNGCSLCAVSRSLLYACCRFGMHCSICAIAMHFTPLEIYVEIAV
jgi:hypothetical protein